MIGSLTGEVTEIANGVIILNVGGVGYQVNTDTAQVLVGNEVNLFIYTAMRETELSLWGFSSLHHKQLFEMLLSVSGVGLKTAMGMLNSLGYDKIVSAIQLNQPAGLKSPGVGKKTSERIIIDLQSKVEDIAIGAGPATTAMKSDVVDEAVAALINLGYNQTEINEVVAAIGGEQLQQMSSEDLVKQILRSI